MATAAEIKEEGNKYFAQQNYDLAVQKFTAAIELDSTNAIFYANRAACYLNMDRNLDAAADALQATRLDPSYTKAWVRLATAYRPLNMDNLCANAWKKAIETMPQDDNEANARLREGYKSQLKLAESKSKGNFDNRHITMDGRVKQPWVVAQALIPELTRQAKLSSAWTITTAYESFKTGVDMILQLTKKPNSQGRMVFYGNNLAIDEIVAGIMSDDRVFHISADDNWYNKYNDQAILEVSHAQAEPYWDLGPEMLVQKMEALRHKIGWNQVRLIIRKLVHLWIMHGVMKKKMLGQDEAAQSFYKSVITVLTWGRTNWSDFSYEDKGSIFKPTFFWKVKSMYLELFLGTIPKIEDKRKRTQELDVLYQEAQSLIDEIDTVPPEDNISPGVFISFHMNPRASALCMQAFYHKQTSAMKSNQAQSREHLYKSALKYKEAAMIYLPDDERRPFFLANALNCLWAADRATFRDMKEIMKEFRSSFDEQRKIWSNLPTSPLRHMNVIRFIEVEQEALTRLDSGRATLDDIHHQTPIQNP